MQAKDMQTSCQSVESSQPFPLVFPVPTCEHGQYEHAQKTPQETSLGFRYIGVQILTARAFRSFSSTLMSPRLKPYSLTEIYAHESKAARLFGLAMGKRWQGRWLHVGDRASLLQARRAWRKLAAQG